MPRNDELHLVRDCCCAVPCRAVPCRVLVSFCQVGVDLDRAGTISWVSSPLTPTPWKDQNIINSWDQVRERVYNQGLQQMVQVGRQAQHSTRWTLNPWCFIITKLVTTAVQLQLHSIGINMAVILQGGGAMAWHGLVCTPQTLRMNGSLYCSFTKRSVL